jgi:hypothetical protein
MPFNGSGIFNRVYNWTTDAANGINILAARMDTEDSGFATGLSNCVTRDGQSPMTATLPLGNNLISGLASGSAATPSIAYQLDASTGWYLISTGNLGVTTNGTLRATFSDTGLVGIGVTPTVDFHLEKTESGASTEAKVRNASNTASSDAVVSVEVAGTSAGDALTRYVVTGGTTWSMGVDNSDSDKWKLSVGSALGTADAVSVDTNGIMSVKGIGTAAITATYAATLNLDCSTASFFYVVLTGNVTALNLNNPVDGQIVHILIKQDATGARTVTGGSTRKGAYSTGSGTANTYSYWRLMYYSSGAFWIGETVFTNAT